MSPHTINRAERVCILVLLEYTVPLCIKARTANVPLPQFNQDWFMQKAEEWGVFAMSETEFFAFEKEQHTRFANLLTTVSPELKKTVITRVLDAVESASSEWR